MRKPVVINTINWYGDCSLLVTLYRREGGVMNRLITRSLVLALLLLVLLSLPSIASADSVLWTLTGVTLSPVPGTTAVAGTATGSFDYDFATNTFSSIDIKTFNTTPSGPVLLNTYTGLLSDGLIFGSSSTGLLLGKSGPDLTGPVLMLLFDFDLVNPGGTVTDTLTIGLDAGGGEGTCDNGDCSLNTQDRFITGGAATSTVGVVTTPEPSALSLLGVALAALLAGVAIRKASQA